MKANQLSRLDLLQWFNEFVQTDYPKIEQLSDGIGYCQVIDAIHPHVINVSKLNFNAKFPDEYAMNLKILDDAFKKVKIQKQVPIEKLSKGKFQENINFLQWLYNYAAKIGPIQIRGYNGYERRLEALNKQRHNNNKVMSAHLIPNNAFLSLKRQQQQQQAQQEQGFQQQQYDQVYQEDMDQQYADQGYQQQYVQDQMREQFQHQQQQQQFNQNQDMYQQQQQQQQHQNFMGNQEQQQTQEKLDQFQEFAEELEVDLKNKMEYNWKILYALDDMIYQRNTLYDILRNVEYLANNFQDSQTKSTILQILSNTPSDFQPDPNMQNNNNNLHQ